MSNAELDADTRAHIERMAHEEAMNPPPLRHLDAVEFILRSFTYKHLPEHLKAVSRPFCTLAEALAVGPKNEWTRVALHKLLEAKDAAVRAHV